MITIQVWDATGNKRQTVELPDDVPMNRVIAVLVDRMNLPRHSPDGQLMSYKFHHKATGRQLLDDQTLTEAGVRDGDIVRLQAEITAGSARRSEGMWHRRPRLCLPTHSRGRLCHTGSRGSRAEPWTR
jgi:uncharacterized ubiquitin-like protein YukD